MDSKRGEPKIFLVECWGTKGRFRTSPWGMADSLKELRRMSDETIVFELCGLSCEGVF